MQISKMKKIKIIITILIFLYIHTYKFLILFNKKSIKVTRLKRTLLNKRVHVCVYEVALVVSDSF